MINRFFYILFIILFTSCFHTHNKNEFAITETPIVEFKICGQNVGFLIDTGAEESILDNSFYLKNCDKIDSSDVFNYISITPFGTDTVFGLKIHTMVNDSILTSFRVGDISIATDELSRVSGCNVVGIVGYDFIKKNKLVIDYSERKIKFKKY